MLKQRILTASLLVPLAVAGIFFLPLSFFVFAVMIIALLGHWEWRKFITPTQTSTTKRTLFSRASSVIAPVLLLVGSLFAIPLSQNGLLQNGLDTSSSLGSAIVICGALWWVGVFLMVRKYPRGTAWWKNNPLLQQLFSVLTLLPFLWSVILLRAYDYDAAPFMGAKLVLMVCLLVWAADTGAYFAGKRFGKHKMAPSVSPNKTVEGLVGGLFLAIAVTFVTASFLSIPFSSLLMLPFIAFITSFASVLGDLVESMFKRVAGIKDSGSILPGHGGILDRIDSLTAAFPVFTVLYFGLAR